MNIDSRHPTFTEPFRFWLRLGFIGFGGPTGQIAILHNELVEKRRWIGEQQRESEQRRRLHLAP